MSKLSLWIGVGLFGSALAVGACDGETTTVEVCPSNLTDCSGTCADTANDPDNCGACGTACGADEVCASGTCTAAGAGCDSPNTDCGGTCTNTSLDPANCGACGTACATGEVCSAGTCASSCGAPTVDCSGSCVDTQTNAANCGSCGNACTGDEVCSGGSCGLECVGGSTLCSGACVDTDVDAANCGDCGTACTGADVCTDGLCCAPGQINCAGTCVRANSDVANCGTCGTTCQATEACYGGTCTAHALFAADGEGFAAGNLYTVNVATGALTTVGTLSEPLTGMAFLSDGRLIGMTTGGVLVEVNPATAETSFVGILPEGKRDLTARSNGSLQFCDENDHDYLLADPTTDFAVTDNDNGNCSHGMAFSTSVAGTTFAVDQSTLYSLDEAGVETTLFTLSTTLADDPKGGVFHNGVFYVFVQGTPYSLASIDTTDGTVTTIGATTSDVLHAAASSSP